MNSLRWRTLSIVVLTLLAVYAVVPTFVYFSLPKETRNDQEVLNKAIPDWLPKKHIKLGLDLQGGVQLVLGVDTVAAVDNKLGRIATEISRWAKDNNLPLKTAFVINGKQTLRVELEPGGNADEFRDKMKGEFSGLKQISSGDNSFDFQYDDAHLSTIREAALEQAERVVRSRVDKWGVSEPLISRRADKTILVQLPGFRDPEKARELLGRTAQLKFKMLAEDFTGFNELANKLPPNVQLERRGNSGAVSFVSEDKNAILELTKGLVPAGYELLFEEEQLAGGKKTRYTSHVVKAATELSGEDVLDANVVHDSSSFDNRPAVSLKFTGQGGKRFAEVTGESVGKRMAIVLDDVVVSDPVIQGRIAGGTAQITLGSGRPYNEMIEEANQLSLVLKSGALPAPITIMEERQVGATLGPELANQGVMSVLVGLVAVLIYMVIYYRRPGVLSCIALILNALFLLALMAGLGFALTLPGFAGFVLTLGMAVDSNVLINERIRQELREGKSSRKAMQFGFDKVFWTIVDANVTTLIAALVLLETNAGGPIKGFSVALIIGLLVSMFTALFCTKVMFELVINSSRSEKQTKAWLGGDYSLSDREFKFNFLRYGKVVTTVVVLIGVSVFVVAGTRGMNWAVDFAGGTEVEMAFGKPVEPKAIRDVLSDAGFDGATLQSVGDEDKKFLIRFDQQKVAAAPSATGAPATAAGESAELSAEKQEVESIRQVLTTKLADYQPDLQRVDFVGPLIGQELRKQGALSIIWAILGIMVYIGFRFDMRFAPGAVAKMVLDTCLVLGFYVFFFRSFDLTAIAALLTAVGYSVNDTIVIYDRIRENMTMQPRRSLRENINTALNETLTRSINTSVATIVSLVGILIFGSSQIWDFAAAMTVGVFAATLSSTFIASSFVLWFEAWKKAKPGKATTVSAAQSR